MIHSVCRIQSYSLWKIRGEVSGIKGLWVPCCLMSEYLCCMANRSLKFSLHQVSKPSALSKWLLPALLCPFATNTKKAVWS